MEAHRQVILAGDLHVKHKGFSDVEGGSVFTGRAGFTKSVQLIMKWEQRDSSVSKWLSFWMLKVRDNIIVRVRGVGLFLRIGHYRVRKIEVFGEANSRMHCQGNEGTSRLLI